LFTNNTGSHLLAWKYVERCLHLSFVNSPISKNRFEQGFNFYVLNLKVGEDGG